MKKLLLVLAALSALSGIPAVAHANVSIGINTPGLSLNIGDRDRRGYYWDGGDWRPPGWWDHHRYNRGRWVYYEAPPPPPRYYWREGPPRWHEGPPPGRWHEGPPPGRWHEGPPPGRW